MTHLESPDMVAFTIGRVALSLMQSRKAISDDTIRITLHKIATGDVRDRISKEMARSALFVIASPPQAERPLQILA